MNDKIYLIRRLDTGEYFRGGKSRYSRVVRTAWTPYPDRAKHFWQRELVEQHFSLRNPPDYEIVTFTLIETPPS